MEISLFVQAWFTWSLTIKLLYPTTLDSSLFLLDLSYLAFATRNTWLVSENRIPIAFLSDYLLVENTALGGKILRKVEKSNSFVLFYINFPLHPWEYYRELLNKQKSVYIPKALCHWKFNC